MTERLHRLEQVYSDSPIYFITFCTEDRKLLLANEPMHETFKAFCLQALNHRIFTGRYVLMPDHAHLFVALESGNALSNWIRSLKNFLSKKLREAGQSAPHRQKGFFDHLLRSEESYSEKWMYMVKNPVRAGLVKRWEDWPWQGEIYPYLRP